MWKVITSNKFLICWIVITFGLGVWNLAVPDADTFNLIVGGVCLVESAFVAGTMLTLTIFKKETLKLVERQARLTDPWGK